MILTAGLLALRGHSGYCVTRMYALFLVGYPQPILSQFPYLAIIVYLAICADGRKTNQTSQHL